MKIELSVTVDISETIALKRAITYLGQVGYKQVTSELPLTFRRGSVLRSLTSFTPKGWRAKATIQVMPNNTQMKVIAVFEITTTGQLVTDKERDFWHAEVDGLEAAICSGEISPAKGIEAVRSALSQNISAAMVIICFTLASTITAHWIFDSWLASFLGIIVGIVLSFVITRCWLRFILK